MGEEKKSVCINGVKYISAKAFAERLGIALGTVYQWNYEGLMTFGIKYLGKLYFEEKAVDPFQRTLVERLR